MTSINRKTNINGFQCWWSGDWRHRNDGPAVIYPDGRVEWWLNNNVHTFTSWCKAVKLLPEEIVEMKLLYG